MLMYVPRLRRGKSITLSRRKDTGDNKGRGVDYKVGRGLRSYISSNILLHGIRKHDCTACNDARPLTLTVTPVTNWVRTSKKYDTLQFCKKPDTIYTRR